MIRFARLALAALALPLPAAAQMPAATLQPTDPDSPVERLGRYLRVLSTSPRDLEALTGAGRAALDVGDANAAIGFFARAEEVAPRDGRVKAGLASALVQMEQPAQALKLFDQAVDLGVPAASIAADRGLAYDLRGENRKAQADYALALRANRSDEVVRRLALSQAMGGDRAAAMATLDPLLRRQDKAAWRASTFVLALTGDARGAVERVGLLVPAAQAQQIAPFLGRLASLKAGEQAQAVHFGHLPSGTPPRTALAAAPQPGTALVPSGAALGSAPVRSSQPVTAPVRTASIAPPPVARSLPKAVTSPSVPVPITPQRPIATGPVAASTVPNRVALPEPGFSGLAGPVLVETRPVTPAPVVTPQPAQAAIVPAERVAVAGPLGPTVAGPPVASAPAPVALADVPASRPVSAAAAPLAEPTPVPRVRTALAPKAEARREPVVARASRRSAKPVEDAVDEADAVALPRKGKLADGDVATKTGRAKAGTKLASLDPARGKGKAQAESEDATDGEATKGKSKDTKKADAKKLAEKKPKVDPKKAKAEAEAKLAATKAKKEPERHWVQVATGANKADLAKAWARVKAEHPGTMTGKAAWTTPLRFTNRVLVGPFKSADEAQGFVNANAKAGFTTSRFTSPAGQAIERVGGK